ncbi:MAG: hypothetical protein A2Y25_08510 [Candidatus Melainabacteria bacterium GWF2_37_15]|nr:MAG: hypothetical protein A2Y25_08510 [Candidatus Melainabacteria bacterium GWF2_37_15]
MQISTFIKNAALIAAIFLSLSVKAEDLNFQGLIEQATKRSDTKLQGLIEQAIKFNPEIRATEARISAAEFRIPQAKALPDPQITLGYQDDTFREFTLGDMESSSIIVQGSQTFPFFGKRKLRAEVVSQEVSALKAELEEIKYRTASKVKELYYDLFLAYKNLDIIQNRTALFYQTENASLSRYSTGLGEQQDVLLAQTEKYNLLTQEEQWKNRVRIDEAQLNALLGREADSPVDKPNEPALRSIAYTLEELTQIAYKNSPELMTAERIIAQQNTRVQLAKKEAYPDFSVNGGVFPRGGQFSTMWMLSTTFNLPIYYFQKQKNAIKEAQVTTDEMTYNLDIKRLELSANVRENYSTITAADRLIKIYKSGLIARTVQDFELALAGYTTGKNDALTVINSLKNLIDYESSYWEQVVEREKAIAKLEAITACSLGADQK